MELKTSITNFDELFSNISHVRVAVIGDVMLDTYWWGSVERISPEGPVPVVALHKKEHRIGGAGNVALNTVSLGAQTTLFSVLGEDEDAEILLNLLQNEHIDTSYVLRSNERITTNKIRIIGRNQQMLRLDSEVTADIRKKDENKLLNSFV
ncbi:MAG: PfkB family carbohydrate kinase, partial [Bacteroidota bacterium]|nr:PfkB family carbohydrate kinase [Bacteroidota bacterium]